MYRVAASKRALPLNKAELPVSNQRLRWATCWPVGSSTCGRIRNWGWSGVTEAILSWRASRVIGMTRTESRAALGAMGEQLAVDYLSQLGLRVLVRNWRCRYGELDVIAADDDTRTVMFVEVKTRTGEQYGGVEEAVTPAKVRRLRRLAGLWLAQQTGSWGAVRIDVIAIRIGRCRAPEMTHIQGVG